MVICKLATGKYFHEGIDRSRGQPSHWVTCKPQWRLYNEDSYSSQIHPPLWCGVLVSVFFAGGKWVCSLSHNPSHCLKRDAFVTNKIIHLLSFLKIQVTFHLSNLVTVLAYAIPYEHITKEQRCGYCRSLRRFLTCKWTTYSLKTPTWNHFCFSFPCPWNSSKKLLEKYSHFQVFRKFPSLSKNYLSLPLCCSYHSVHCHDLTLNILVMYSPGTCGYLSVN